MFTLRVTASLRLSRRTAGPSGESLSCGLQLSSPAPPAQGFSLRRLAWRGPGDPFYSVDCGTGRTRAGVVTPWMAARQGSGWASSPCELWHGEDAAGVATPRMTARPGPGRTSSFYALRLGSDLGGFCLTDCSSGAQGPQANATVIRSAARTGPGRASSPCGLWRDWGRGACPCRVDCGVSTAVRRGPGWAFCRCEWQRGGGLGVCVCSADHIVTRTWARVLAPLAAAATRRDPGPP